MLGNHLLITTFCRFWLDAKHTDHLNASASAWTGILVDTFFVWASTKFSLQSLETTTMTECLECTAASQFSLNWPEAVMHHWLSALLLLLWWELFNTDQFSEKILLKPPWRPSWEMLFLSNTSWFLHFKINSMIEALYRIKLFLSSWSNKKLLGGLKMNFISCSALFALRNWILIMHLLPNHTALAISKNWKSWCTDSCSISHTGMKKVWYSQNSVVQRVYI